MRRDRSGLTSVSATVLVAVILVGAAIAGSVALQRQAPLTKTPDLRLYYSTKPVGGSIALDLHLINIGNELWRVTEVRLLSGGVLAWSRALNLEIKPGESRAESFLVESLRNGRYVVEVLTDRGPLTMQGGSPEIKCKTEEQRREVPIYGWREVKVGERPVYKTRTKQVWDVVGYEKVPVYETRTRQVQEIVGYRGGSVSALIPGHGIASVSDDYYTHYVLRHVDYRWESVHDYSIHFHYQWRCEYRTVPQRYCHTSVWGGVTCYSYNAILPSCSYGPAYGSLAGWAPQTFSGLMAVDPVTYQPIYIPVSGWFFGGGQPVYGWRSIEERIFVGYRDEPIYGWKTVTEMIQTGFEPIFKKVWDVLRYEERTERVRICPP